MRTYISQLLRESLLVEDNTCGVFTNTTRIPFFDGVLSKDLYYFINKGMKGNIEYMSPDEYIARVAKMQNTSIDKQHAIIMGSKVQELLEKMKNGVKMDIPHLEYMEDKVNGGQEGRHRAMAAKEYGCEVIPVGVYYRVDQKEILNIALKLEKLTETEAKEKLRQLGFKNVDDYRMVKYTLDTILKNHDGMGDTTIKDKVGEWSDTFPGRGVSTLIKYEFDDDYKKEIEFLMIYDTAPDYNYYLDSALDMKLGRTYSLLYFDEGGGDSKKIDILGYDWDLKLPFTIKKHIRTMIEKYQDKLEDHIDLNDDFELVRVVDELSFDTPEFKVILKYLQKMVYGSLKYDAIKHNMHLMELNTNDVMININHKGAKVYVKNNLQIDDINEYDSGHEMLVKHQLVMNQDIGFKRVEDFTELTRDTMVMWVDQFGLDNLK